MVVLVLSFLEHRDHWMLPAGPESSSCSHSESHLNWKVILIHFPCWWVSLRAKPPCRVFPVCWDLAAPGTPDTCRWGHNSAGSVGRGKLPPPQWSRELTDMLFCALAQSYCNTMLWFRERRVSTGRSFCVEMAALDKDKALGIMASEGTDGPWGLNTWGAFWSVSLISHVAVSRKLL